MATLKAALAGAFGTTLPNPSSPELSLQTSSLTAATISTAAGSNTTIQELSTPTQSTPVLSPPPLTEQIANLLNLAQYMLNGVREQQYQQQEAQQHRRRSCKERRNFRLQANMPYQRSSNEAYQSAQGVNCSVNNATNTNASANDFEWSMGRGSSEDDGRGVITNVVHDQPLMSQTPFHSAGHSGRRHNNNISSHYMQNTNSGDNKNFRCSICLDSYLLHRPMVTQCGHLFCKRCIRKCVSGVGKCPMCNCKLKSNSVFRVYF